MGILRFILNVIWVLTAGIWLFLGYMLAGVVACIFIITIPFGLASFRIAGYVLWPFGREVVEDNVGALSTIGNVIWFLIAGLWLALGHLLTAVVQAATIVGIPLAWANVKLIPVTCFPFGKKIVTTAEAQARVVPHVR